jgi:hypothetical protein
MIDQEIGRQAVEVHRLVGRRLAEITLEHFPDGDAPEEFLEEIEQLIGPQVEAVVHAIKGDEAAACMAKAIVGASYRKNYELLAWESRESEGS